RDLDRARGDQTVDRIDQRYVGARDRRGAGTAVGLQHVAIERDGALAEQLAIDAGAQRTADQSLDLQRAAALLAARGLAVAAGVGGARQHAVLGGDPAFALAAQERGHPVFHAGGAEHPGLAETDQYRAFGVAGKATLDAHFTQLVGRAAAGARERDAAVCHGADYRLGGARVYHSLLVGLGIPDDPQHDRLRQRRARDAMGHARVRAAFGQPPLPRDRGAPA